jgi:hypothetical protein
MMAVQLVGGSADAKVGLLEKTTADCLAVPKDLLLVAR